MLLSVLIGALFLNSLLMCWLSVFWALLRAFRSGVSNVKYLAYDTPNTNIHASWNVPNLKFFFTTCYSAVPLMKPHCSMLQNFLPFFYLRRVSYFFSFFVTLYLFPLLPAQESYSRSLSYLPEVTLSSTALAANLAASFSTIRRRSCHLILQPSPPTSTAFTANLQISLNQVMDVRFWDGFRCVGFRSALCWLWVDVLGQLG